MNNMLWTDINTTTPPEGIPVLILFTEQSDAYASDVAYFCDGSFYNLKLDPNLGVLRKEHVNNAVKYWTTIPPVIDLKTD